MTPYKSAILKFNYVRYGLITIFVNLPDKEVTPGVPAPAVTLNVPVSLLFALAVIVTVPALPVQIVFEPGFRYEKLFAAPTMVYVPVAIEVRFISTIVLELFTAKILLN